MAVPLLYYGLKHELVKGAKLRDSELKRKKLGWRIGRGRWYPSLNVIEWETDCIDQKVNGNTEVKSTSLD